MRYRLLLDENIEHAVVRRLTNLDFDVERVHHVRELGPGTDDARVTAYALKTDRILLTYDDDFVTEEREIAVIYVPEESLSAGEVTAIVRAIAAQYPQSEIDGVVYASRDWT